MNRSLLLAAAALLALGPARAFDLEHQVHGFAAQAVVFSEGNNALGSSTDGSVDFYEAGLNVTAQLAPDLLGSAQLLWRQEGDSEDPGLRLDYALLDYRFLGTPQNHLGLRAGRVKNSFGLFNDTRDVVFARPGILLPQSVYFDGQGFRSFLFASDGGQLYGGTTFGDHFVSLAASRSVDFQLSEDEKRRLSGGSTPLPGEVHFHDLTFARLQDEWDGERLRVAFSYLHGAIDIHGPGPFAGTFDVDMYVASARWNAERFALTAEYVLMDTRGMFGSQAMRNKSDGAYLQFDLLLAPRWMPYARVDLFYSDRNDRDGRQAEAAGRDRHTRYARDFMGGLKWLPDEHWGVWAEAHVIDGSATVPEAENTGRPRDPHWSLFLLMAGYRF